MLFRSMVHAGDRPAAIDRLRRALDETEIAGIQTTLPFHRFVARHDGFRAGELSIEWVAEEWDGPAERAAWARASGEAAAHAVTDGSLTGDKGPSARLPGDAVVTAGRSGSDGWAAAARDEAVDRWPG